MTNRTEGQIYLCRWKKSRGSYELWLESDPKVRGVAADFTEAYYLLWDIIMKRFDDGEAHLEFPQGLPVTKVIEAFQAHKLVTVAGNGLATFDGDWGGLFNGGICRVCKKPLGPRSELTLQIDNVPQGDAFLISNYGVTIKCFSEKFVTELQSRCGAEVEFKECSTASKKRFYELVGAPSIRTVAVKSFGIVDRQEDPTSFLGGYKCRICKAPSFRYIIPKVPIGWFIAASDIPDSKSSFTIQAAASLALCITAEEWLSLSATGLKQITSDLLGIAPSIEVVREPVLPER
jgi:hypothetical protein